MSPVNKDLITTPPPQPLLAASILSADFGRMAEDCRGVLDKGVDLLHLDVMDGHFVPNLTMGVDMCRALRQHFPDVYLDVHLMVDRPDRFVEMFAKAGANLLTFHLEVCSPQSQPNDHQVDAGLLIQKIHDSGMHAGMAVNPPTPPDGLSHYLDSLDLVLVMSVNPGLSGQSFIPEVLDKTRWISERINPRTRLEMDGGLNTLTAPKAVTAGVDVIVSASALFGTDNKTGFIDQIHQLERPSAQQPGPAVP